MRFWLPFLEHDLGFTVFRREGTPRTKLSWQWMDRLLFHKKGNSVSFY